YSNAAVFHLVRDQLPPQERVYVVRKHADFSLQQTTGSLFGVPSLFDYESLPTRRFAEFYTMLRTGQHMRSLVDFYYPIAGLLPQTTRHRLLDLAATRYLLVDSSEDTTGALRDPPLVPITEVENVRVYDNTTALPRARWVPLVNVEPDAPRLLWRLAWGRDDLARAAFVETSPPSGFTGAPGDGRQGSVIFVQNDPERVVLRVDAPQRGFLVLADQWFPGWQATVGGTPVPILRADYVFRLVEVPAGRSTVEFRYVPDALLLGALIGIPYSYVSPLAYLRTNLEGTYNVLQAARDIGVGRVLITSTSETYGTAQYVPIDEKHPPNAQSPYAASKVGADQLALSFHRAFGLDVRLVRPFNTYGPRQSARAIIPTIVSQIVAGRTR